MPTTTVRLTLRHAPTSSHLVDYAVSDGDGPTVVLAPSAWSPLALWRPQLRRFGPRARFVAWLPRADGTVSIDDCLVALEQEGVAGPFAVWGHGAGAPWAVRLAAEHATAGLVVFSGVGRSVARAAASLLALEQATTHRPRGDASPISGLQRRGAWSNRSLRWTVGLLAFGARRSRLLGRLANRRDATALAAAFLREPLPRTLRLLAASPITDALPFASAVHGPALVMTGRADPVVEPEALQQLGRQLPRSTVRVVPDAGHLLPRELPDLVGLELERWFGEAFAVGAR